MRLLDGVQIYAERKRSGGANYAKGIQSLSAFCRHAGDVPMSSITERQVTSFSTGRAPQRSHGVRNTIC